VLHGGSGIHPDDMREALQMNVVKVNIGADLFRAWVSGLQEGAALEVTGHEPPHHVMMTHASAKVTELARKKLSLMGAPGHAKSLQQRLEEARTDLPARVCG
jgi:fructose/tagatose bisphosphate aldolase